MSLILYHWAPCVCRAEIFAQGLLSAFAQGEEDGWDSVFLAEDEPDQSDDLEDIWLVEAEGFELELDEGRELWRVRGGQGGRWFMTPGPIGPERLELLSEIE